MEIKLKKVHPNAVIPSYANPGDAGVDLTAVSVRFDGDLFFWEYDTGISIEIPEGYVGLLFPRSSISKTDLFLTNAVGVLDAGYRGSIKARFKQTDAMWLPKNYQIGDRILQLIVIPFEPLTFKVVENLGDSVRGTGGYGSTGK